MHLKTSFVLSYVYVANERHYEFILLDSLTQSYFYYKNTKIVWLNFGFITCNSKLLSARKTQKLSD